MDVFVTYRVFTGYQNLEMARLSKCLLEAFEVGTESLYGLGGGLYIELMYLPVLMTKESIK